ncbi:glycosyl transferase, family 39 [Magnetococcus marinus MC-1]|uniref:Glycosyl transferase, family 39 n=1 Tax=Magnetococcus marinus (strain ATCC BAA-1437 / JCM 17883 / MC-1) TaxID=156889 RepID=A0LBL5_MAGMM|nr:glycosyl transferase [Magnetococcus marinus]ABK45358.1 glycosyl transferase, family 39 [Magnetococcus marinus MC-1]
MGITQKNSLQEKVLWALLAASLLHAFYVLYLGFELPILGLHGFRQTQTAISAYYMVHEGAWLPYMTPILGTPWMIPLEFPLYQWIVAVLHIVSGIEMDQAGRLVSFFFFLLIPLPVITISRYLNFPKQFPLLFAIFFYFTPLYLFWGRTFLIEVHAVFLAVLWLAALTRYLDQRTLFRLLIVIVVGILGGLVKVTTFAAFALFGAALCLHYLIKKSFLKKPIQTLISHWPLIVIFASQLVAILVWVSWSDSIKVQGEITKALTSDLLTAWNFGSWEQRTELQNWYEVLIRRTVRSTIGWGVLLVPLLVLPIVFQRRVIMGVAVTLLLYITPFLIFTNLHIEHTYYQVANALFLVATLAVLIAYLSTDPKHQRLFLAALVVVVGSQIHSFYSSQFYRAMNVEESHYYEKEIGDYLKDHTPKDSVIVIHGTAWTSAIPYYSERKGIIFVAWISDELIVDFHQDSSILAGEFPVPRVNVICTQIGLG